MMFLKTTLAGLFLIAAFSATALADTTIIPLNSEIALERTVIPFHASPSNSLPWGFVEGSVANHVEGYPVIIQIFKGEDPIHFAQTGVSEDGAYEYKFRVRDSVNGKITNIFEGDYTVKIFKVVYLEKDPTSA